MYQRIETSARYSGVAKLLHWLIAALILANILLAWRMEGSPGAVRYAIFQLHKSIGITVLLLTLIRIGWRLTHRPPPLSAHLARWERTLAHIVHHGFYLLMLGLPLTGWLLVSTSPTRIATLLYGTIPWPHIPVPAASAASANELAEFGHESLAYLAYLLIVLHVAGALKHHIIDRDGELGRMLPGRATATLLDARLGAIGLILLLIAGLTSSYPWFAARQAASVQAAPAPAEPAMAKPLAQSAASVPAPQPETIPAPKTAAAESTEKPAEPSEWIVDKAASSLGFRASWNGAAVEGGFGKWDADIRFDPDALDRSAVTVRIDMGSVTASDDNAAGALPGGDWFDSAAHPRSRFTATKFRALGGDRYETRGMLSIRDTSRPLTLPFTLRIDGDKAKISGTATLSRTAFGVGQGQWTATDEVADAVSVTVQLSAIRKK
ncbi:cytochrome B [Sphingomonas oleivorans]|uniref:Cytochrome B n=1 Tax=Sphingomonas oleivorans TaxID=1735121 RepID=A0A2T5FVH7_9SPHN|nr:cytochrome b/b6 domain-containing protein [Sphingomonas oleivorans]PTQ09782.1 cytochrome B [Sphingomonas oleivorans]